ncbi:MAG: DM13 domain-containing protein [Planctomycetota bacterium]
MKAITPRTVTFAVLLTLLAGTALAATTTQYTGKWTKKNYKASGTWSIVQNGEQLSVKLDSKFKTKKAPDLKIFLSPKSPKQLNNKNATRGALKVGLLKSHKGAQTLAIPAGTNLDDYASIIIHCEQYSKLWTVAAFQ